MYRHVRGDKAEPTMDTNLGWRMDMHSKQMALGTLKDAINQGVLYIYDRMTRDEIRVYERKKGSYKVGAMNRMLDDAVKLRS